MVIPPPLREADVGGYISHLPAIAAAPSSLLGRKRHASPGWRVFRCSSGARCVS